MSDDPETARQIAELAQDDRPLLVLDVDEVVLEFIRPFTGFLNAQDLHLRTDSFRLHGNVVHRATGLALEDERVSLLMEDFFLVQGDWQVCAGDAPEVLENLAKGAEIVMLTAMPHRHRDRRRELLDKLGLPYPLLTTEMPKGPAVKMLRGDQPRPVAFVDDIPHNLISVRKSVPDAALFHIMAHAELRALLPPLEDWVMPVMNWRDAEPKIAAALGFERVRQATR
jgi:hypothetical protein